MKTKTYKLLTVLLFIFLSQKINFTYAQNCTICATCDSTITGIHNGNINVPSTKTYCISAGAVLNGSVTVSNASNFCNTGTINGNVTIVGSGKLCNEGFINTSLLNISNGSYLYNYGEMRILGDFNMSNNANIFSYCSFEILGNGNFTNGGSLTYYGILHIYGNFLADNGVTINVEGALIVDNDATVRQNANVVLKNGTYMNCRNLALSQNGHISSTGAPLYSQIVINGTPTSDGSQAYVGSNLDICWNGGSIPPGSKSGTITYCVHNLSPTPPIDKCNPIVLNSCPIIVESISNSGVKTGVTTFSWNHTTVSSSNTLLIVVLQTTGELGPLGNIDSTKIYYNTRLVRNYNLIHQGGAGNNCSMLCYLKVPDAGTNTISITLPTSMNAIAYAYVFSGVNTATTLPNNGALGSAISTYRGRNTVTATDKDLIIGHCIIESGTMADKAGQTNYHSIINPVIASFSTRQGTAGVNDTIRWNFSSSVRNGLGSFYINGLGAGPALTTTNATICNGNVATITVSGSNTYTWSTTQTGSAITVNPTITTTYTVTGSDAGGCTSTGTAVVTVNAKPAVAAFSATICYGSSTNITASGATTYTWNTGGTGSSISVNPTTNTTYTVTGTNASGCTNTATAVVNVNSKPTILAGDATICNGASTIITASGATTYTWNTGATGSSLPVTPGSTVTYNVTGTNGNGCTNTAAAVVTVNAKPNVTASGNTICTGAITNINASGANTYTWSNSETGSTITVNPTQTSTYTVTGTDVNQCTNTSQAIVIVNNKPNITATGGYTCPGSPINVVANNGVSYTWSTGFIGNPLVVTPTTDATYTVTGTDANGCTNTAQTTVTLNPDISINTINPTICFEATAIVSAYNGVSYTWNTGALTSDITVTPSITTTYYVTGANTAGCTGTGQAVVTINPKPNVTALGNTICIGASTNITSSGANTYTWSNGQTGNLIPVTPGSTTTYTVTGTDGNGCTNTAEAIVNVNPLPNVTASGNTICIGAITNINASGANTYTWSNSQTGSNVTVNPIQTITYTVTGTDGNGCTNTAETTVNVNPLPNVSATGNTICIGAVTDINASGAVTYTWSNSETGSTVTVNPTLTTTYSVTGTDANTCTNTALAVVNVNPLPNVTATGNTICFGVFSSINASGANTYTWSNTMTGSSITISPTITTIYNVTGTDLNGCTNTAVAVMTVNPNPIIAETPADEYCEQSDGSIKINISSGTPGFTYFWSNGSTTKDLDSIHAGTYTVTVIDAEGCSAVKTVVINNINIYPNGNPSVDTVKALITHLFLFNWNGVPGLIYHWSFGDGSTSSLVNPVHIYEKTGTYTITLIVTSVEGCEKEYVLIVEVINPSKIEVFNVVTPNHDGLNEIYKVKYTGNFTEFSMVIYNRWGTKLFETNDIDGGWDPRNHPDGVYYYIIKAKATDDKIYDFHGYVHVER
ncbi:MAG: gliding motility-associated C-terminal domain-containing protein [Bacteroidales bacterium]|nr:gliding motility-associated C-terminal domain-containing protein [Bacteroidales bacterium]